jgi:hypothetical protein
MAQALDPALKRDLTEAKAALARHGVVIIRAIETDLEPALMSAAKSSMSSSPGKLGNMDEDELDKFSDRLRQTSISSVGELKELYIRLMAKLGTENPSDLAIELEGIEQLFKWERVAKAVLPVNERLAERGFGPIVLEGPGDVSESFELELEERWPPAFERFKLLVDQSAVMMKEGMVNRENGTPKRKVKKAQPRE